MGRNRTAYKKIKFWEESCNHIVSQVEENRILSLMNHDDNRDRNKFKLTDIAGKLDIDQEKVELVSRAWGAHNTRKISETRMVGYIVKKLGLKFVKKYITNYRNDKFAKYIDKEIQHGS